MNYEEIILENARRNARLEAAYDPKTGVGCYGERVLCGDLLLPTALVDEHPDWASLPHKEFEKLRFAYDFEYWAVRCVTIKDKLTGRNTPFTLNRPQRRVFHVMEADRQAGRPVRVILLKARQWGGSTLVQIYMAWIQIVLHKQWNSIICGHLRQASCAIKRMYNTLVAHYPDEFQDPDAPLKFRNFEGSSTVQQLQDRDSLLVLGTARSEDCVRGYDLSMAHLTEVAFWPDTPMHSPVDVVRSIGGTIPLQPDTVVVYESTANGMGNFFHDEWLRAKAGRSDKRAIFVPWHEIEIYSIPVDDPVALWDDLDSYERRLWDEGVTLEQLNWYHHKRLEYGDHSSMMAEFPSNDIEAFTTTGNNVFDLETLDRFAADVDKPADTGGVYETGFIHESQGNFAMWKRPERDTKRNRYMVVVDVGGRSEKSDYSVIAVMDTHNNSPDLRPEIVGQWRGHVDHDLLGEMAVNMAHYYNDALLVVESNTIETEGTDCDAGEYILGNICFKYRNTYIRNGRHPGFHTNRHTKAQAIYALIRAVRERTYVERDQHAINEMATYERTPTGTFAAKPGHHDDIVMTRAIALSVLDQLSHRHLHHFTKEDTKALLA